MYSVLKTHPKLVNLFVTVFHLGRSPWAPGTIGTLAGPLVVLAACGLPEWAYLMGTLLLSIYSMGVIDLYQQKTETQDGSEIVIDEVLGYMVAMALLPLTWQSFLLAFILFRFFDILKPFPIGYIDKNIGGGLGVVVDDLVAGIATNLILHQVLLYYPFVLLDWNYLMSLG